jgi:ubiquinone/menaquinone biosynthesis C-methylase UbiE/uncharacterized protein YbaR (Trm112 family)
MQTALLNLLRCPLTKTALLCTTISTVEKSYGGIKKQEVNEAILRSETGLVFPVINGIPRMLIEAVYDYAPFLQTHLPDYAAIKKSIEIKHASLLKSCVAKNEKTKKSFEFEWSFLKRDQTDKIWHEEVTDLTQRFLLETGENAGYFNHKTVLDVGCGHGIMTSKIASLSGFAVGIELSKAVEKAYEENNNPAAFYVQGDLQFLPFEANSFDVLYSSGVIHHTNDTQKSLSLISTTLKKNGLICLWLYHPQTSRIHNWLLQIREITKRMSIRAAFVFLLLVVFPPSFLYKKLRRKRTVNYREEMIDLLDAFTPEFRFEIPHNTAKQWLHELQFTNVEITTTDQFGFSIVGIQQ